MKKCGTKRCGSNTDGSCTIGSGPACAFFSEYAEQPAAPVESPSVGSIVEIDGKYFKAVQAPVHVGCEACCLINDGCRCVKSNCLDFKEDIVFEESNEKG